MTVTCTYVTTIVAACPVNGKTDVYNATFVSGRTIKVEDILEATKRYLREQKFQEDITVELAQELNCKVTTVGYHSGVKTTVEAE